MFWQKVDGIVKERRETIQAMSVEERLSQEEVRAFGLPPSVCAGNALTGPPPQMLKYKAQAKWVPKLPSAMRLSPPSVVPSLAVPVSTGASTPTKKAPGSTGSSPRESPPTSPKGKPLPVLPAIGSSSVPGSSSSSAAAGRVVLPSAAVAKSAPTVTQVTAPLLCGPALLLLLLLLTLRSIVAAAGSQSCCVA